MRWLNRLRKGGDDPKRAEAVNCHVCGITRAQVEKNQKRVTKQLEKQFGKDAAFIGFGGGAVSMGFLGCPKCGKIACSKCALELPGHSEKSCPHCREDYVWGSVL